MKTNPNALRATEQGASNIDFSKIVWSGSVIEKTIKDAQTILDGLAVEDQISLDEAKKLANNGETLTVSVVLSDAINDDSVNRFNKIDKEAAELADSEEGAKLREQFFNNAA